MTWLEIVFAIHGMVEVRKYGHLPNGEHETIDLMYFADEARRKYPTAFDYTEETNDCINCGIDHSEPSIKEAIRIAYGRFGHFEYEGACINCGSTEDHNNCEDLHPDDCDCQVCKTN